MPLLDVTDHAIAMGARLRLDLDRGAITDETAHRDYIARPLPPVMVAILRAGGLVPYLTRHGGFVLPGEECTG